MKNTARDWYKDAVFYEVHVKAFKDANGDGIGDFAGLTESLDYIQDLQPEIIHDSAGGHRANTAHQPAAQVLAQPFHGRGVMDAV